MNCSVAPFAIEGFAGVTTIDCSVAAVVTVRPVEPFMPFRDASIVVLPAPTPFARPLPIIVATAVFDDVQVAWLVRFCVLASL